MPPAIGADVGSALVSHWSAAWKEASKPSGHCRRCAGGGSRGLRAGRFKEAREVFDHIALDEGLIVFLTLPAYRLLDWVGR